MLIKTVGAIALVSAMAMPAAGQSQVQVEVGVTGGYTASDGITTASARIINGKSYNEVAPVSGGNFGFTFGVYVTPHAEVEFLYARQFSKLEASGVNAVLDISHLNVDSYFGNFVYNWNLHDGMIRPFAFGGLGATHYAEGSAIAPPPVGSIAAATSSLSKFAFDWGGGVKLYPSPHVGIKAMVRLVPTYIQSNPAGVWCDPYFGCWAVGDAQYSNQFEFSGGVTLKFDDNN